jgi:hypothetical protein
VVIDLEYRGRLPSEQGGKGDHRIVDKQKLRLHFSEQLQRKWRDSSQLRGQDFTGVPFASRGPWHYELHGSDNAFYKVNACGFDILPLVTWHNGLSCAVEVTVVGDTRSAAEVIGRGDLDNGLKVLFDALRMPKNDNEVPGNMFGSGQDRMYCLLEDDSLIHKFSVEAIQSPYSPAECRVSVKATVVPADGTHQMLGGFR